MIPPTKNGLPSMRSDRQRRANKKYWQTHRSEKLAKNKLWRDRNPGRSLFINAKSRAKREGIEFSISFSEIAWRETCPVFGFAFKRDRQFTMQSASLDRIDNAKGYVHGNVIVVSKLVNTIKGCATVAMLRRVADFYEAIEQAEPTQ